MSDFLLIAAREARDARDAAEGALRRAVAAAAEGGASIRRIAAALDMSTTTIQKWIRKESERGH